MAGRDDATPVRAPSTGKDPLVSKRADDPEHGRLETEPVSTPDPAPQPDADHKDKLIEALGEFVRVEADREVAREPEKVSKRSLLVLFALALNTALFLSFIEDLAQHPIADLVSKVVPFLFGATFIALLDDLRRTLFKLCSKRGFAVTMVAVFAILVYGKWLSTVPVQVPVDFSADAHLFIDNNPYQPAWDQKTVELPLMGVARRNLISEARFVDPTQTEVVLRDSVKVGLIDRLRVTVPARVLLGERLIDLSTTYPLMVTYDSVSHTGPRLHVTGLFPPDHLRRLREQRQYSVRLLERAKDRERRGVAVGAARDSARVTRRFAPGTEIISLRLPAGTYVVTLEDDQCSRVPRRVRIERGHNELLDNDFRCRE